MWENKCPNKSSIMYRKRIIAEENTQVIYNPLLGGKVISYDCPDCRTPLYTKQQLVCQGDACPVCPAEFIFEWKLQEPIWKKDFAKRELTRKRIELIESIKVKQATERKIREEQRTAEDKIRKEKIVRFLREDFGAFFWGGLVLSVYLFLFGLIVYALFNPRKYDPSKINEERLEYDDYHRGFPFPPGF